MKKSKKLILPLAVAAMAATVSSISAATTIFADDFSGGAVGINGVAVDEGGSSWEAAAGFTADGGTTGAGGSATLDFTPVDGLVYTLDASITGISGDGNWIGLGFADGNSTGTGVNNRFINGSTPLGRAWMFARGNNDLNPNSIHRTGSGSGLNWASLAGVDDGGDVDMRIVLDTTGGTDNWTATWFAKTGAAVSYTEVGGETTLIGADSTISSVGFVRSNTGVNGTLTSFSLSSVPEPSSTALLGLGSIALLVRRRR